MVTLRDVMPVTAIKIDGLRELLGGAVADALIKRAMGGEENCFFSSENHLTFGTPSTVVTSVINWDDSGRCFRSDPQWMTDAIEFALSLGIEIERVDMSDPDEARDVARQLRIILAKAKYAR